MTEKEALLFFPHDPNDDLDDLWEERLFEQKQFFLTRPPIAKVFQARLNKLEKQYKAYLFLSGELDKVKIMNHPEVLYSFPNDVIETFNAYHSSRNIFKHEVLKSSDFNSLRKVIDAWMTLENTYAAQWFYSESKQDDIDVVQSKEPDPMVILEKLKKARMDKNIKTFDNLQKHFNVLDEVIRKEVKRLTLLKKD